MFMTITDFKHHVHLRVDTFLFLDKVRKTRGLICGDMVDNTCLDHTEKPPSRPTDYVIRHILHVSRPNSNVGSEWRKSTRIIDRISQRSNRQDQSAEAEALSGSNGP